MLGRLVRILGPSLYRDHTISRIDTDDNITRKFGAKLSDKFGFFDRLCTDYDKADTRCQISLYGFHGADTTTYLDRQIWKGGGNLFDHIGINRVTFKRTIEVHQMETLAALRNPLAGHSHRVI